MYIIYIYNYYRYIYTLKSIFRSLMQGVFKAVNVANIAVLSSLGVEETAGRSLEMLSQVAKRRS